VIETDRPPIPPDLAAHGWRWNDRGLLTSADGLVTIVRPDPFAVARQCEATRARLAAGRKAKQTRMELEL